MKISNVGKILTALIFASVIGGISAVPAFGQDNYRRQGPQQRGYYDDRGRHDNRGWHDRRGWQGDRGRRAYRPRGYYHPGPAYGPPPAFIVPVPSPGIRIFLPFPFDLR